MSLIVCFENIVYVQSGTVADSIVEVASTALSIMLLTNRARMGHSIKSVAKSASIQKMSHFRDLGLGRGAGVEATTGWIRLVRRGV